MLRKALIRIIRKKKNQPRGQGLVELTLVLPALLIVISGLIEFGFILNSYMALVTAGRNAARFGSDGQYNITDVNRDCDTTRDYFRQLGCLVNQELRQEKPFFYLNDNSTPGDPSDDHIDPYHGDDIIVSVFTVTQGDPSTVDQRFPSSDGWSYAQDFESYGIRNHTSAFTSGDIASKLDSGAPNTGILLVEVFYTYEQLLKLPWITAFVPEFITLHTYTFMPLSSAEPTPTPEP